MGFKSRQCESMASIVLHSEQAEYFYLQVDRNEGSKEVSRETAGRLPCVKFLQKRL